MEKRSLGTIDAPKAFFHEAARKEALKVLDRRHGMSSLIGGGAADVDCRADALKLLIRRECRERLQELLLRLPRGSAAALILTAVQGLTRREAAAELGITLEAIERRITLAYRTLRAYPELDELYEILSTLVDGGVGRLEDLNG